MPSAIVSCRNSKVLKFIPTSCAEIIWNQKNQMRECFLNVFSGWFVSVWMGRRRLKLKCRLPHEQKIHCAESEFSEFQYFYWWNVKMPTENAMTNENKNRNNEACETGREIVQVRDGFSNLTSVVVGDAGWRTQPYLDNVVLMCKMCKLLQLTGLDTFWRPAPFENVATPPAKAARDLFRMTRIVGLLPYQALPLCLGRWVQVSENASVISFDRCWIPMGTGHMERMRLLLENSALT